jgi:hypothetical protein
MENIERRVWREARAMTRREVITKAIARQLTWLQAAEIIGIKPRQMRRLRYRVAHYGLDAVMDHAAGDRAASESKPAPALRLRHHRQSNGGGKSQQYWWPH